MDKSATIESRNEMRFVVGEHSASRSLFGLRKSRVIGSFISLGLGFLVLLGLGGTFGLIGMAALGAVGLFSFLIGFRGATLDQIAVASLYFTKARFYEAKLGFRYDVSGMPLKIGQKRQIVSGGSGCTLRVSEPHVSRRSSRKRAVRQPDLYRDDSSRVGRSFSVPMMQRRRSVVGYEIVGDRFLYLDKDLKSQSAINVGRLLETFANYSPSIKGMTILYSCTPGGYGEAGTDMPPQPGSVAELQYISEVNSVRRRTYLLLKGSKAFDLPEFPSFELDGSGETDLELKPMDSKHIVQLLDFGGFSSQRKANRAICSSWSYLEMEQRLVRLFDIVEFPRGEVSADFLVPFITSLTSESILSFNLKLVDNRYALRKVRSRRSGITADIGVRGMLGFLGRSSETNAMASLETQEMELDMGYQMFSVSGTVAIFANNPAELELLSSDLLAKSDRSDLFLECAWGRQIQRWRGIFGVV